MNMAEFTDGLNFDSLLDPPGHRDKTGFPGVFDFYLKCELGLINGGGGKKGGGRNPAGNPASPSENTGPSILAAALQEQLGLKLVSEKGPVEFLVIDRVERPLRKLSNLATFPLKSPHVNSLFS